MDTFFSQPCRSRRRGAVDRRSCAERVAEGRRVRKQQSGGGGRLGGTHICGHDGAENVLVQSSDSEDCVTVEFREEEARLRRERENQEATEESAHV